MLPKSHQFHARHDHALRFHPHRGLDLGRLGLAGMTVQAAQARVPRPVLAQKYRPAGLARDEALHGRESAPAPV
jgi:hypothetical protein